MEKNIVAVRKFLDLLLKQLEELVITLRDSKTKMYIVRLLKLTNWLCGQGYQIMKVEDSEKNPKYKVFLFEDTKQIRDSASEYLLQKGVQPD